MVEDTTIDYIDFEEEKAKLWQRAYSGIRRIIEQKDLVSHHIGLPCDSYIRFVVLESSEARMFEDCNGNYDYCESFEDDVLFEVYSELYHALI